MSDADNSHSEGRRRLIKSAAAAPIVFTLPTGSVLAATSISCHTKGLARFETTTPAVVAGDVNYTTDGWVRTRLQSYNFRVSGDTGSTRSNGFLLNGNYYKVSGATATLVSIVLNNGQGPQENSGQYFYVLVDYPIGNLILDAGEDVTPMAGASCWNSLAPGSGIPSDNIIIR